MLIDYYIGYLAQALTAGGSETTFYMDRITTVLGETVQTSDVAAFGRGILTINPKGDGLTSYPEIASFTAVDATNIAFTGGVRGLDKASISQTTLKRYFPPGTPVIISVTSQTISDIKTYIDSAVVGTIGTASDTTAGSVKLTQSLGTLARAQAALVTQQVSANMTVQVKKFSVGDYVYLGGNSPAMTAPVSHPRIDLIAYDKVAAAIVVKQGAEAVSPSVPQMSGDYIPLAYIYHIVGETSVKDVTDGTNGYVYMWCEPVLLENAGSAKYVETLVAPTGYLLRDGSSFSARTYPELARALLGYHGYGTGLVSTFNAATDVVTANSHGLLNGDPVFFRNIGGALPGGITANTIFYVISSTANTFQISTSVGGSAVNITSNGTGTTGSYGTVRTPDARGSVDMGAGTRTSTRNYDSTIQSETDPDMGQVLIPAQIGTISAVNSTTDIITTSANHGFTTGDPIYFTGTTPAGVTASTLYFAIVLSVNTLQLSTTYANTIGGATPSIVDITNTTTGAAVLAAPYFNSPRNQAEWVVSGMTVVLSTAGTAPTGLTAGTYYAMIQAANPTRIYLCSSNANAYQNTPVLITGAGSGIQTLAAQLTTRNVGDSGGEEKHHLTVAEMPSHDHQQVVQTPSGSSSGVTQTGNTFNGNTRTGFTGGDLPHNNVQPFTTSLPVIRY